MKITWFGGTVLRIHAAGRILVCDDGHRLEGAARVEVESGADQVFGIDGAGLEPVDLGTFRPRRPATALEERSDGTVMVRAGGARTVLVDAPGEPALLLAAGAPPPLGRWAGDAVVVLFGEGEELSRAGVGLLAAFPPRLLALAGADVEAAFADLGPRLSGTGLFVLEPGQAVEV